MRNQPPPGIAVGKSGIEVTKLVLMIESLCERYRVNAAINLPPEPFQEAMAAQARIEAIRLQQREELRERGLRGLAKANLNAATRAAARITQFRKVVTERGGLSAINKTRLAAELGVSRSSIEKWCRKLREEEQAGPPRCPACQQLLARAGSPLD